METSATELKKLRASLRAQITQNKHGFSPKLTGGGKTAAPKKKSTRKSSRRRK
jgi:hypothetical protein